MTPERFESIVLGFMRDLGLSRPEAEEAAAIATGLIPGDVLIEDDPRPIDPKNLGSTPDART